MTNSQNLLKKFFGYDNFRPGQEEIINNILNQNDCSRFSDVHQELLSDTPQSPGDYLNPAVPFYLAYVY